MSKFTCQPIEQCRICGNSSLEPVLSLGAQVLTGVFPKSPTQVVSTGPLELVKCNEDAIGQTCGLLQLRHTFNPDEMYRGSYGYRSGLNLTMTQHLQDVASAIAELVALKAGDVVLDIGSNDATLLKSYPNAGLALIGIDPSAVNFRQYYPDNIALVTDYFSAAAFRSVMGNRRAKVVTSIAMFYDLESPLAFAMDIREILADDGVWVFEQSYMPTMLARNAYDTVCHEHLEYYGLRQIKWLADRAGFKILDVELNDVNGGSFRVTVTPQQSARRPLTDRVDQLQQQELVAGLHTLRPYLEFKQAVFKHRDDLRHTVADIRQRGRTILGYGASTKGNVVLQFCGFTVADIPAIAERNPEKYGGFTPGTLIPMIPEQAARNQHPDYFLALPWHFRNEFLRRERAFLDNGGKFLFPLPQVEIIGA
ncbi:MAG: class I SAM-dependent methyltransferase [Verrucomicrobiota bacterium]|jgi:C-methyltransferase C-terminal domain/Putative zinc binding domain/Methyltransferase domain